MLKYKQIWHGIKPIRWLIKFNLTTRFEELKMSEDESFDSFYSKLNEVIVSKFNLGEKTEDSKIVRKILRSLPESFHAKVTAIDLLLLRPLMRRWKSMTHRKKMWLTKMLYTL